MQPKLPNFFIIGAYKSGTTSLYRYLNDHPQIFMSPIKEPNYFSYEGNSVFLGRSVAKRTFPVKTFEEYIHLFENVENELIIGEASPMYLVSLVAAERIKKLLPEAKLLTILRNPADRAFSSYLMRIRNRNEKSNPKEVFNADPEYLRSSQIDIQIGMYFKQLKRYFDLFPRSQLKVCLYDDLKQDGLSATQDIFAYLGVDASFEPSVAVHHNVGSIPKNVTVNSAIFKMRQIEILHSIVPNRIKNWYRTMYGKTMKEKMEFPQDLREQLLNLYREDILNVQELIQRDLTHWLEV